MKEFIFVEICYQYGIIGLLLIYISTRHLTAKLTFCFEAIMTKAFSAQRSRISSPLPPPEARTLNQRLQAADQAWQTLVRTQECPDDSLCVPRDMSVLSSFSRFLHELIPDQKLRGEILRSFANQQSADISFGNGMVQ